MKGFKLGLAVLALLVAGLSIKVVAYNSGCSDLKCRKGPNCGCGSNSWCGLDTCTNGDETFWDEVPL